jgi:lipoprotein signal peptidase
LAFARARTARGARAALVGIRPRANRTPWAWRAGSPAGWIAAFGAALAAALAAAQLEWLGAPLARFGLGAALGGALGNLYDRLRHGAVLDFLDCGLRARGWRSNFNLADVGILGGLLCVCLSYVGALAAALSPAA